MRIKERIAAEKKAAQDILAKGEENLTDEEFEQLKQHVSEARSSRSAPPCSRTVPRSSTMPPRARTPSRRRRRTP